MILILVFGVLISVILYYWYCLIRDSKKYNVPGPFPLPVVGNAHIFAVSAKEFLKRLDVYVQKYDGTFRIYLFSDRYICLTNPKYIEPLMKSTEIITKGESYNFIVPWLGQGLLTGTGQRWKKHRKFLTPSFHFNILQNYLPVFCRNEAILTSKLKKLADGRNVNVFPLLAAAALDNMAESVMAVSVNAQKDGESKYVKSIGQLTQIMAMRMRNPFIGNNTVFNYSPYKKKQDEALRIVNAQTRSVIKARREELEKLNITELQEESELGIKNKHAFLDLLLLSEIDGAKINDEHVKEEVDTFLFEGHDTTTSALAFCVYCISNHPEVQEKLFEEQQAIFGSNMNQDPTYNEIFQMKYLELVLKESMRLYPPVPLISRLCNRDCELGDLKILKGSSLIVSILHMHRRPDLYDEPLKFWPERFEAPSVKGPFNWLAFSAGPRNCIGQKFAMLELKVMISGIVRKLELFPSNIQPELCADLILRSQNGVQVQFKSRN